MDNQLLSFDEKKFSKEIFNLSFKTNAINSMLTHFKEMGFGRLDFNEIPKVLSKPKDILYDKIIINNPSLFGGITVDKNKAMELFAIPGLQEFLQSVENAVTELNKQYTFNPALDYLDEYYKLNDDGLLELKPSMLEKVKGYYEKHATSETSIAIYKIANTFIDNLKMDGVLNKVANTFASGQGIRVKEFLQNLFLVDDDGNIKVNPEWIAKYN